MTQRLNEDIITEGKVTHLILPTIFLSQFKDGDTTPSVLNCSVFKYAGSAVSITFFDAGSENQSIRILGNANITIVNGSDPAYIIKTNTGANKTLAANKCYVFTLIDNIWYEDA